MAAAVLGHAARRLGGGALRQTREAAVELGQRRLMPRFTHTEVRPPCTCGKPEKDGVLRGIQKQKEALYDAIAEAEKTYGNDYDGACRMNRTLLRELSDHVQRGPGDATWDSVRAAKKKHDFVNNAGFVTLVTGGTVLYFNTLGWVFDRFKSD